MKRRFVVSIKDETPTEVLAIIEYAKRRGMGWWHWITNSWLMTSYDASLTVSEIRDEMVKICNKKWVMVIEVNSVDWANFGPQGDDDPERNISKWVDEHWTQRS